MACNKPVSVSAADKLNGIRAMAVLRVEFAVSSGGGMWVMAARDPVLAQTAKGWKVVGSAVDGYSDEKYQVCTG